MFLHRPYNSKPMTKNSNSTKNRTVAISLASVMFVFAAVSLFLFYFGTSFKLAFFIAFNVLVVLGAGCYRGGFGGAGKKPQKIGGVFGIAAMTILVLAIISFLVAAATMDREPLPPDPVGANSVTNLLSVLFFPFLLLPIALPAVPCWFASIVYEKWPTVWYVLIGLPVLAVAALSCVGTIFLLASPQLWQDLFG